MRDLSNQFRGSGLKGASEERKMVAPSDRDSTGSSGVTIDQAYLNQFLGR